MSTRVVPMAVFIIMLSLNASHSQAQAPAVPSRLTLGDAIRLLIASNPALAAARNEIQALEGDRVAASKRPNPAVSLQMENFPIETHPGSFFGNQEITLQLDYEIERGGRRRLRTEAVAQAIEVQQQANRNQMRLLQLDVARTFALAVLAKSNLEASQSLLEQTERMISLSRVRFEQGDISTLELNRTEAEKLKFQDDVLQADLLLRNAKSTLLALLHATDISQDVDVVGTLQVIEGVAEPGLPPPAPFAELVRIALERRPDMVQRLEERKRANNEELLQRAMRTSNLTVGAGYRRNSMDNSFVLGVSIPLKIFNRNEGEIIRAEAEKARASSLIAVVQKEIELDVRKAHNAVETNRRRVDYIQRQHLKKAEEASRVTSVTYHSGEATLIDYLDAQRTYRDMLRIYNQALYDERVSLYELASSIGLGVE